MIVLVVRRVFVRIILAGVTLSVMVVLFASLRANVLAGVVVGGQAVIMPMVAARIVTVAALILVARAALVPVTGAIIAVPAPVQALVFVVAPTPVQALVL